MVARHAHSRPSAGPSERLCLLKRVLSLVLCSALSANCGLVFGGSRQVVRIDSSPTAAKIVTTPVTQDYASPASISLERKKNYSLTISKDGYTPRTIEIQRHVRAGMVVLDIVFGLVPVIVDAVTGGWYGLSPKETTVTLDKVNAAVEGPQSFTVSVSLVDRPNRTAVSFRSGQPGVRAVTSVR